jgi:hypothetical protein
MERDLTNNPNPRKAEGNQYQLIQNDQTRIHDLELEKDKRIRIQNMDAKAIELVNLSELQKEMAYEQTKNIDELNKNFSNTTTLVKKTEKEVL